MPEFGLGSHSYNPVHGTTRNPYDLSRTAGGSSGGAAAALAARLVAVADGSDFMGSLRNPAAFCNVYGFRPTFGRVPADPVGDVFLHQFATNGPMARTPRDLALLLETIAGPDPRDPHALPADASFARGSRPIFAAAASAGSATGAATIRSSLAFCRSARRRSRSLPSSALRSCLERGGNWRAA